jgi:hypothetical protein
MRCACLLRILNSLALVFADADHRACGREERNSNAVPGRRVEKNGAANQGEIMQRVCLCVFCVWGGGGGGARSEMQK